MSDQPIADRKMLSGWQSDANITKLIGCEAKLLLLRSYSDSDQGDE